MVAATGKQPFYGWRNVFICFLCYGFIFGFVFYGFSVTFPAMVKAMGWKRGDASIAQTVRALMAGVLLAPLVGHLILRWGARKTMLSGGFLLCVGLALLGTVAAELWQWILLWGVVGGAGYAFVGGLALQTIVTHWFNKHKGAAMGILFTGAGVGGFVGQPLFAWIIKQTGKWQMGWLAAAVCAFLGVLVLTWLKNRPEDYGQHKDGISPEEAQAGTQAAGPKKILTYRTKEVFTVAEAIKTRQLWILILCVVINYGSPILLVAHGVFLMLAKGLKPMQAAYVMSFYVLGGAFARIPGGWLSDRIEGRWILFVCNIVICISMFAFWQGSGIVELAASVAVLGFVVGVSTVVVPVVLGSYYGVTHFPKILGFTYPVQYGLGALVPVIAGYAFDFQKSYDGFFVGLLVVFGIGTALSLFMAPPRKAVAAVVKV